MIDEAVERQYSDSKELLALWRTFHDFFAMGVKGENLTPEKEEQFLEIKSRVAMLHDSFMDALTHDQNIGQQVLNIISRAITLKHLNRQSVADIKKMEIEWHESYLLLNETIGVLEEKRNELAQINERQYKAAKAMGVMNQRVGNFVRSGYFKMAVVSISVLFATVGVQVLGIYDYNELGRKPAFQAPYRIGKTIYHIVNADSPWVTLDVVPRKKGDGWTGFKSPELKATGNSVQVPLPIPAIQDILAKATERRKESVFPVKANQPVDIYTFLLPEAEMARQVESEWNKLAETPWGKRDGGRYKVIREVNAITILNGPDPNYVTDLGINAFNQK